MRSHIITTLIFAWALCSQAQAKSLLNVSKSGSVATVTFQSYADLLTADGKVLSEDLQNGFKKFNTQELKQITRVRVFFEECNAKLESLNTTSGACFIEGPTGEDPGWLAFLKGLKDGVWDAATSTTVNYIGMIGILAPIIASGPAGMASFLIGALRVVGAASIAYSVVNFFEALDAKDYKQAGHILGETIVYLAAAYGGAQLGKIAISNGKYAPFSDFVGFLDFLKVEFKGGSKSPGAGTGRGSAEGSSSTGIKGDLGSNKSPPTKGGATAPRSSGSSSSRPAPKASPGHADTATLSKSTTSSPRTKNTGGYARRPNAGGIKTKPAIGGKSHASNSVAPSQTHKGAEASAIVPSYAHTNQSAPDYASLEHQTEPNLAHEIDVYERAEFQLEIDGLKINKEKLWNQWQKDPESFASWNNGSKNQVRTINLNGKKYQFLPAYSEYALKTWAAYQISQKANESLPDHLKIHIPKTYLITIHGFHFGLQEKIDEDYVYHELTNINKPLSMVYTWSNPQNVSWFDDLLGYPQPRSWKDVKATSERQLVLKSGDRSEQLELPKDGSLTLWLYGMNRAFIDETDITELSNVKSFDQQHFNVATKNILDWLDGRDRTEWPEMVLTKLKVNENSKTNPNLKASAKPAVDQIQELYHLALRGEWNDAIRSALFEILRRCKAKSKVGGWPDSIVCSRVAKVLTENLHSEDMSEWIIEFLKDLGLFDQLFGDISENEARSILTKVFEPRSEHKIIDLWQMFKDALIERRIETCISILSYLMTEQGYNEKDIRWSLGIYTASYWQQVLKNELLYDTLKARLKKQLQTTDDNIVDHLLDGMISQAKDLKTLVRANRKLSRILKALRGNEIGLLDALTKELARYHGTSKQKAKSFKRLARSHLVQVVSKLESILWFAFEDLQIHTQSEIDEMSRSLERYLLDPAIEDHELELFLNALSNADAEDILSTIRYALLSQSSDIRLIMRVHNIRDVDALITRLIHEKRLDRIFPGIVSMPEIASMLQTFFDSRELIMRLHAQDEDLANIYRWIESVSKLLLNIENDDSIAELLEGRGAMMRLLVEIAPELTSLTASVSQKIGLGASVQDLLQIHTSEKPWWGFLTRNEIEKLLLGYLLESDPERMRSMIAAREDLDHDLTLDLLLDYLAQADKFSDKEAVDLALRLLGVEPLSELVKMIQKRGILKFSKRFFNDELGFHQKLYDILENRKDIQHLRLRVEKLKDALSEARMFDHKPSVEEMAQAAATDLDEFIASQDFAKLNRSDFLRRVAAASKRYQRIDQILCLKRQIRRYDTGRKVLKDKASNKDELRELEYVLNYLERDSNKLKTLINLLRTKHFDQAREFWNLAVKEGKSLQRN